jgi:purine-binding chemotaxis protein CheW
MDLPLESEETSVLPLEPQHALLVFHLGGALAALPLENVERILPMAELAHPPGLPSMLEGFLNLAGIVVPVLRLDRLLQLPVQPPGLYSMLILLKGLVDSLAPTLTTVAPMGYLQVHQLKVLAKDDLPTHLLSCGRCS